MARLVLGLSMTDKVIIMQKRNPEGVMLYMLYPVVKLTGDDLDEAMQVTARRAEADAKAIALEETHDPSLRS